MVILIFQLMGVSGKIMQFGNAHFLPKTLQLIFNHKFRFLALHCQR